MLLRTSHWLYLCTHRLRSQACPHRVAAEPTQHTGRVDLFHLFTAVWLEITWPPLCFKLGHRFTTLLRQTLLSEYRQRCESWKDVELGVGAVRAVRDRLETRSESGSESQGHSDTTGKVLVLVRWVVLLCFSPHRDTAVSCLMNTFSSSTDCYDDWRQASPTFAIRPTTPAVRVVAVVHYAVFHNASAAQRPWASTSLEHWRGGRRSSAEDARIKAP